MTFLQILKIIAALGTIATGLLSLLRPRSIKDFTGLEASSSRAVTEIRSVLGGLFVALIVLVNPLGWAIAGGLFFAGCATVLGSRHYVRNVVIGAILSVGSFYAFYSGLGIPLPAGILDGIL